MRSKSSICLLLLVHLSFPLEGTGSFSGHNLARREVTCPQRRYSRILSSTSDVCSDRPSRHKLGNHLVEDRRSVLQSFVAAFGAVSLISKATSTEAVAEDESLAEGLVSVNRVADLLHTVPTFAIVDKKGVPFMVVGEDAKVDGYFFTTFNEASRILDVARKSAEKSIEEAKRDKLQDADKLTNPWKDARVSTLPLDTAVTLVIKSSSRQSGGGSYFKLAAAEADIEDALAITGKDDLAEGRVPLFYYEDFTVDQNGESKSPLYFRKSELQKAYRASRKSPGGGKEPKVLVTELFAVLSEMVRPGGTDDDLKTLVFVPPAESLQRAKDCVRQGGNEPPLVLGQRNLVL